jgi:xanthine dehydrogenase YagR molybdenum-binding subunit
MLKDPDGAAEPLAAAIGRMSNGAVEAYTENSPHGVAVEGRRSSIAAKWLSSAARCSRTAFNSPLAPSLSRYGGGTREIRCPRVVGAFAARQIVDPLTAKSQLMGGLIWGVSSALHEATEIDRRHARYYNTDFAEYLIPVNADIETAEVIIVPEDDRQVNDLGIKGLG